jgi:hypothetical protein
VVKIRRRIESLEQVLLSSEILRKRWVVVVVGGGPANLANSTCTRRLSRGRLFEIVQLDGSREGLTDGELNRFIESFPIQGAAAC